LEVGVIGLACMGMSQSYGPVVDTNRVEEGHDHRGLRA